MVLIIEEDRWLIGMSWLKVLFFKVFIIFLYYLLIRSFYDDFGLLIYFK